MVGDLRRFRGRPTAVLMAMLVLGMTAVPTAPAAFGAPGQQDPPPAAQDGDAPAIRLKADTFRPQAGEQPDVPPGLTIAGYAQNQRGYYLVQFTGPVRDEWKTAVEATGATLLDYVPDHAFKVAMNPGQAQRVERLDEVGWVGLFHPAYKLAPTLERGPQALYDVRIEDDADVAATLADTEETGVTLSRIEGRLLTVIADGDQVEQIAQVLGVAWIEASVFAEKHNESGGGVIMGAAAANTAGYDGSGQIVAVADTGLGDTSGSDNDGDGLTGINDAHPHVPSGRITSIIDYPAASSGGCYTAYPDGPQDPDSGHGTHTVISVLGEGDGSGRGTGTAPGANLVFQAVEDYLDMKGLCSVSNPDGYYLVGLPLDLHDLYQDAYDEGARVHSNSWGSDVAGDYTLDSADTDDFVFDNPDMTITFSAGNAGTDANSDGVVDDDSIGAPGTAKNVITVGASENQRDDDFPCDQTLAYVPSGSLCKVSGVNDIFTYGGAWASDYPAEPLFSDPSAGDAEQMAAFSSRGPTDDGRIKPDVVAPGTWILSGYSDLYQEGYDGVVNPANGLYQYDGYGYPLTEDLKYLSGTSMSNPLVAGGAAVVRDYYATGRSHPNASAALVKATLINSAVDLLDENNDGVDDNDYPIPNTHEGWGRVDLAAATAGTAEFLDATAGLATGQSSAIAYDVGSGAPLKVTLVWSDAPSTEAAAKNLVNDLDLEVTAPDGTTMYRGNVFTGGWSTAGGSADDTNNVENVYIDVPTAGLWTVTVEGTSVPSGPQPYALVVDYEVQDVPPIVAVDNPLHGSVVTGVIDVQVGASDTEDASGTLTAEWQLDGGDWMPLAYDLADDKYEDGWDTSAVDPGEHTIVGRVTDTGGNVVTDTSVFTVCDQAYEPNDDSDSAEPLESGLPIDAAICPEGDVDWFSITADAGETVVATLTWEPGTEMTIQLLDSDGFTVLDEATSTTGDESVSRAMGIGGVRSVGITGSGGSAYTVEVVVRPSNRMDYDGDGVVDVAVFRPSEGKWYFRQAGDGWTSFRFGLNGDVPVPADYDGDGVVDVAVFRPSEGKWYFRQAGDGWTSFRFGLNGDVPVPADYDGDGVVDVAVFRPSEGKWYFRQAGDGWTSFRFGLNGDVPVPADYDGDGVVDVAVFRPSEGKWYFRQAGDGWTSFRFGLNGDVPVPADYDGDGVVDVAVFRPSEGKWYFRQAGDGWTSFRFGLNGDVPVPADYDGDGVVDVAVFRPSEGKWYFRQAGDGWTSFRFGLNGDVPLS